MNITNNIDIRQATADDISAVKMLLERHHSKNLTGEQRNNGFVTTDMTSEQLTELVLSENGITIAIDKNKNKNSPVGLLLGASWLFLKPWPMFAYMQDILSNYAYKGKPLCKTTSYQYGPVCIDNKYRSQGTGERLLAAQKKVFSDKFDVAVTFVNKVNPRSYRFHTRAGFETVGEFSFNSNEYYIMAISTCSTPE